MGAVPVMEHPGILVILGQPEDKITLARENTKLAIARFGPDSQYHGLALAIANESFSICTSSAEVKTLYIGDHRHMFRPEDWVLVHFKGEIVYNPRFVCKRCNLPSGIVRGTKPIETGGEVQIIECQECNAQLYPPIAQTA